MTVVALARRLVSGWRWWRRRRRAVDRRMTGGDGCNPDVYTGVMEMCPLPRTGR